MFLQLLLQLLLYCEGGCVWFCWQLLNFYNAMEVAGPASQAAAAAGVAAATAVTSITSKFVVVQQQQQ
jgi:hypothetical protein